MAEDTCYPLIDLPELEEDNSQMRAGQDEVAFSLDVVRLAVKPNHAAVATRTITVSKLVYMAAAWTLWHVESCEGEAVRNKWWSEYGDWNLSSRLEMRLIKFCIYFFFIDEWLHKSSGVNIQSKGDTYEIGVIRVIV